MGTATTCTTDSLPSKLVKHHLDTLLPMVTKMVNFSLSSGSFADVWKTAVIIPLFKKKILQNYRPVFFMSKLAERVCLSQLVP
jgi:hypothetical protein